MKPLNCGNFLSLAKVYARLNENGYGISIKIVSKKYKQSRPEVLATLNGINFMKLIHLISPCQGDIIHLLPSLEGDMNIFSTQTIHVAEVIVCQGRYTWSWKLSQAHANVNFPRIARVNQFEMSELHSLAEKSPRKSMR